MASYNNFSQKERAHLDANAFSSPQSYETNKVNEHMIKNFDQLKDRWREYCSYFRSYP
jgi:hypothetical protein